MRYTYDVASMSCIGPRETNQDYYEVIKKRGIYCAVVADGLGGSEYGNYISKMATETIATLFKRNPICSELAVANYISAAADVVTRAGVENKDYAGMKTTIAVVLIKGQKIVCGHVGDTRIYIFGREHIIYQSKDHSRVQERVDRGEMTMEEIRYCADRNIIFKALGSKKKVEPYICTIDMSGQAFSILVCTDGFWEPIQEWEMLSALQQTRSANEWTTHMANRVQERLPLVSDNYTCVGLRAKRRQDYMTSLIERVIKSRKYK